MFSQEEHYFKKQDVPRSSFLNIILQQEKPKLLGKMTDSRAGMKKILMPERKCFKKKIEGTVPS